MSEEMTDNEIRNRLSQLAVQQKNATMKVVDFTRALVPLLRDRAMPEVALELEARLSQVEQAQKDFIDFFSSDPTKIVRVMTEP